MAGVPNAGRVVPIDTAGSPPDAARAAVDAAAVAEVVHEVRNYFHRLYYWFDLLREQPLRPEGHEALADADATLRALDGFIHGAFELFRPIELSLVRIAAGDLVDSVATVVRRHAGGVPLSVEVRGTLGAVEVAIDPGRMSALIEGLLARLLGGSGDGRLRLEVEVQHGEPCLLTLRLDLVAVSGGLDPGSPAAEVAWAGLERVVLQHGGRIALEQGAGGQRRAVVVLPAASAVR